MQHPYAAGRNTHCDFHRLYYTSTLGNGKFGAGIGYA